jgi:hypothetical protein
MNAPKKIIPVVYDDVRRGIRNGDIALCRPSSLTGEVITRATDTKYSHATMLGWASPHTLMVGETREHHDARLIDARSEFCRWPGAYDVFSVRTTPLDFCRPAHLNWYHYADYDGDAAWTFVCHSAGSKYGWNHISRVGLRRILGQTWIAPVPNNNAPQWPRDCSGLVHAAMRLYRGPILRPFDCDVVPGDFADPRSFDYRFTVFATHDQVAEFERNHWLRVHGE